ncbi:MAG TPA: NUDIX hydrolase [Candidatus Saccharimonadales bacterium]|nr:NUDIX hydrolase [Candidatus Saccharimonadales bacterium]
MITCTFENGNQNSLRHVTVGCIVIKDGKILLAKRSKGLLEAGKWNLLGGYANRDETTMETGVRETLEESGWSVKNLQLLRVNDNPDRPHEDRQNIDFIYIADAVKEVGKKDWESEALQWFPLDSLPPIDQMAFDHLDSIELYKKYLKSPFHLPVIGKIDK